MAALADVVGPRQSDAVAVGHRGRRPTLTIRPLLIHKRWPHGLATEIDAWGRTTDRRGDFDSVYGDWEQVASAANAAQTTRLPGDVIAGLRLAHDNPAALADPRHEDAALALMSAEGEALAELARIADAVRSDTVGEDVTYVVNRNLNFTNVCYTGCRFCAFAQRKTDADAFTLSPGRLVTGLMRRGRPGPLRFGHAGAVFTQICRGTAYFDLARAVKARQPGIHLHAFSPMEVVNGATRSGMSIRGGWPRRSRPDSTRFRGLPRRSWMTTFAGS